METYDFESKHLYRQRREQAIDHFATGSFRDRKVAYLDTREALDTISYLRRGYRPKNLWAINRDPVEVALLTQKLDKLGLPRVNTCGLEFEDALARRVPEVSIIDFDGMSCIHQKLLDMLNRIVNQRPTGVYGITVLGGREDSKKFAFAGKKLVDLAEKTAGAAIFGEDAKANHEMSERLASNFDQETSFGTVVKRSHYDRLARILESLNPQMTDDLTKHAECSIHVMGVRWDVYISISNQPMVWAIFRTIPHKPIQISEVMNHFNRTDCLWMPPCREVDFYKHGSNKSMDADGNPIKDYWDKQIRAPKVTFQKSFTRMKI